MLQTLNPPRASLSDKPAAELAVTGPVVGVRTTRIYCRMFCRPGRAPKVENCLPFLNAAAARAAGFRACKQCRPDEGGERVVPNREPVVRSLRYAMGQSPLGFIFVAVTDQGISAIFLYDGEDATHGLARLRETWPGAEVLHDPAGVLSLLPRIIAFLTGADDCADLPLDLSTGTSFQRRVWETLRAIPRGTTRTYGEVAEIVGAPGAARAVGTACATNLISLLIPCHRVVRSGGALGGYYWGLDRKQTLLELEREQTD